MRVLDSLSPSCTRCLALPPSLFMIMTVPLGISIAELATAMSALSSVGLSSSEAAVRLRRAMDRMNELRESSEEHDENYRIATRCPATELVNLSEEGNPMSPKSEVPKHRLIRRD